jgi:hypothetical protein
VACRTWSPYVLYVSDPYKLSLVCVYVCMCVRVAGCVYHGYHGSSHVNRYCKDRKPRKTYRNIVRSRH